MKKNLFRTAMFGAVIASLSLYSCDSNDGPSIDDPDEVDGTRWISLTAAFPDDNGTAGNGGTRAYAITPENAADPNYEVRIFDTDKGFVLKSSRTARVQASADGKYLYNIQYTGAEGGVFNKYKVSGEGNYEEDGFELNTAVILGTSPRWVKSAEGIGVGVSFGEALDPYIGEAPNFTYRHPKGKVRVANIDLDITAITNTGSIDIDLGEELESQGYHVWRADVPVLNQAKNKVFIGLGIRKHDVINGTVTYNNNGVINGWETSTDRTLGTTTLVADYPSLRNPRLMTSDKSIIDNLGYRTMTQYVGADGHVYQATATSGPDILRISKSTDEYDQDYHFNLNTALNIQNARIRSWVYAKDGIAVILYDTGNDTGGYIALADLTNQTAQKITTDVESDVDLSTVLEQYQNIGIEGDYAYIPLTPSGKDGNLYVLNWKTGDIAKGAKLINQSGSFYIGAY